MRHVPLKWGPWQAFKYVMRRGVVDQRWSTFAVLYERFRDIAPFITTRKTNRQYRSKLSSEVFRVLSPGGSWVLLEANDQSYGVHALISQIGRVRSLSYSRSILELSS